MNHIIFTNSIVIHIFLLLKEQMDLPIRLISTEIKLNLLILTYLSFYLLIALLKDKQAYFDDIAYEENTFSYYYSQMSTGLDIRDI